MKHVLALLMAMMMLTGAALAECPKIAVEDYPTVDGSTATLPLSYLLITTEGMLMYLTKSELEQVFMHMRRLLLEFGGKWITMDNELVKGQNRILEVLIEKTD